MTVITMPDGKVVDFGDMPPDQIKALIRQKYPDIDKQSTAQPAPAPQEPYSGVILPFSKDAQGNVSFDPSAGIFGSAYRLMHEDPTSDAGIADAAQAATIFGPSGAASRGGLGWAGVKPKPKSSAVVPGGGELKGVGGFGFELARQMDVRYTPQSVQNMAMMLQSQLFRDGFRARQGSAPQTFAEIKGILRSNEPGSYVSIDDLHAIRRSLQNVAQDFNNPTDQRAAVRVIQSIDEFIARPDPKNIMVSPPAGRPGQGSTAAPFDRSMAGAAHANAIENAKQAGKIWGDAVSNYAAGKRSDRITGIENNAEIDAAVANSGGNLENRIRTRVGAILKSPKLRSGYSDEEIAIMEQISLGTPLRNAVRSLGNLGGGGGALAALMGGMGYGFGGPIGLGAAVVGPAAMKIAGNRMAKNALRGLDEAVRQRSPAYQERAATAPPVAQPSPEVRSMMGRPVIGVLPSIYGQPSPSPQMTPEQFDEYLRRKALFEQGA